MCTRALLNALTPSVKCWLLRQVCICTICLQLMFFFKHPHRFIATCHFRWKTRLLTAAEREKDYDILFYPIYIKQRLFGQKYERTVYLYFSLSFLVIEGLQYICSSTERMAWHLLAAKIQIVLCSSYRNRNVCVCAHVFVGVNRTGRCFQESKHKCLFRFPLLCSRAQMW